MHPGGRHVLRLPQGFVGGGVVVSLEQIGRTCTAVGAALRLEHGGSEGAVLAVCLALVATP